MFPCLEKCWNSAAPLSTTRFTWHDMIPKNSFTVNVLPRALRFPAGPTDGGRTKRTPWTGLGFGMCSQLRD